MQRRSIKEQQVSLLGMGCMRLPKIENTDEIDLVKTEEMIDLAYKSGINYFDTAYPYHNGKSEIVIGNILKKYPRDSFCLADKMPIWNCKTLDDAKNIFNEQLEKCKVEYFDFYLCHAMNLFRHNLYKELGVYEFLEEMRKSGKIRHLGFSYHDAAQNIIPIADKLKWDFAQIQFNYLDVDIQECIKQYDELTKRDISVVVMEPVRGGMLANVCEPAEKLFKGYRPNKSVASWALRFVAKFSNIKVILSGMSNLEQLTDNINTFTNYEELNEEELDIINEAKKEILGNDFIPCTGCRYCLPCPFGVAIPKIFSLFNNYGINKEYEKFIKGIEILEKTMLPINCKKCKKCMNECPQHINIPLQLEKINKLINR